MAHEVLVSEENRSPMAYHPMCADPVSRSSDEDFLVSCVPLGMTLPSNQDVAAVLLHSNNGRSI